MGGPCFPNLPRRQYSIRGTKSSRHAADTVLAALRPATRAANTLAAALVNHHRRERYKRGAAAKRRTAAVTHAASATWRSSLPRRKYPNPALDMCGEIDF